MQAYDCLAGPGSISLTVSGGSGKYTFTWTGPSGFTSASKDISNLIAGIYDLIVDDGHGCLFKGSWGILSNNCSSTCTLKDAPTLKDASACNAANGSVSPAISGGSGNYHYTWYDSNFNSIGTSKNLTSKLPGYYILFVEDLDNPLCSTYFYYTIKSGFKLSYTMAANTKCMSPFTGSASVTTAGGSGVYVYTWTYPDGKKKTGSSIQNHLHGGNYQVEVLDVVLGCSLQQPIYIFNPSNSLAINGTPLSSTSCSPATGEVDITISNGSGNYLYTWIAPDASLASSSEDLKQALPGQYTLFVNDTSSACTAFKQFTVGNKIATLPTLDSTATPNTNCSPPFNGKINITPKSTRTFLYSWTGPAGFEASTKDLSTLASGDYALIVTDSLTGCTHSTHMTVPDKSLPALEIDVDKITTDRSCSSPDGEIFISITSSNKMPYTLSWKGPDNFSSTEEDIAGLASGSYILTATAMCNRTPVISPPVVEVDDRSTVTLKLSDFITDMDNNLDTTSFEIIENPASGAEATLQKGSLLLSYKNTAFSGVDKIKIKACDLLKACTENNISITVDAVPVTQTKGDITVYNAVSANRDHLNSYLRIENIEKYTTKVCIYNRWGDEVYRVENYNNEISCQRFEGISKDGKELPTGTYFYKIEFADKPAMTGYLGLKTE